MRTITAVSPHVAALLLATSLSTLGIRSQDAPSVSAGPPAEPIQVQPAFFAISKVDLGARFNDEIAITRYPFENTSSAPIVLNRLTRSNALMEARVRMGDQLWRLDQNYQLFRVDEPAGVVEVGAVGRREIRVDTIAVPPGGKGVVELQWRLTDADGPVEVSVEVGAEDAPSLQRLSAKAHVTPVLRLSVPLIELGEIAWGDHGSFEAAVTCSLVPEFDLQLDPQGKNGVADVELIRGTPDGAPGWTVRGQLVGSGPWPVGQKRWTPSIAMRSFARGTEVRLTLELQGTTVNPVVVEPASRLNLGVIPAADGCEVVVRVRASGGGPLEVSDLRLDDLSVDSKDVAVSQRAADGAVDVVITVASGIKRGTVVRGVLHIATNHGALPTHTQPFSGMVR